MPASAAGPRLGVVIPAFNEEAGIRRAVEEVCAALRGLPIQAQLLVVEDGSRDRTLEILTEAESSQPLLTVVRHPGNQGYGAALRTGLRTAADLQLDYVLFMDSDLTNSPADIAKFVPFMLEGKDVIKATRYSRGGGVDGVPFGRWIISAVGNRVAGVLFGLGLHDVTNGFRAVRVSLLSQMRLTDNGFSVIMEEASWYHRLGARCAEVPVTLTTRSDELRPTSFGYRPSVVWRYLWYALTGFFDRIRKRPFRKD
jgi:glycosyltransferase involved in cell wall biosynthesis